jgi:hypothetical protein
MNFRFRRRDIDVHFRRIYLETDISDLALSGQETEKRGLPEVTPWGSSLG